MARQVFFWVLMNSWLLKWCFDVYITNPDMDCIKLGIATFKFGDQKTVRYIRNRQQGDIDGS
jgi:hypothetical protein